ncbi:calcium-dependent protein kinase [Selaginella moellendorffii]|nr:calcium-dependent protein kinase [Selaginella moellendorffii]XP_002986579.2 calcium-dependent protein kinase [Selaginella moellendorffii]|eukprot:XP_002986578.2 calcium-dependent protein kinase [Selaginella moellendorffii]
MALDEGKPQEEVLLDALWKLKELYELLKIPPPQEEEAATPSTESMEEHRKLMDEQMALVRSMEAMEFNQASMGDLFSVEKELGQGGQSSVYQIKRKSDGQLFACKSIRVTDNLEDQAELEMRVLTKLSKSTAKSGVVQLVDVFKEQEYHHLVMELCQCSLRDVLKDKGRLSEHEAALVMKKVARTVGEMHDMGIAHRDINTANILLGIKEKFDSIKVADFGTCWLSEGPGVKFRMSDLSGTQAYSAPEMVNSDDEYDEMVDVWGVGIVLYEILSGQFAFWVGRKEVPVTSLDWTDVSEEAKDLILQLLHLDPRKRLPIHEIEKHPWVVKHSAVQQELCLEMDLKPGLKRRRGDQEEAEESLVAKKVRLWSISCLDSFGE